MEDASKAAEVAARMMRKVGQHAHTPPRAAPAGVPLDELYRIRLERGLAEVPAAVRGGTVPADNLGLALQAWATDPQPRNLVLVGPVGAGKSYLAGPTAVRAYSVQGDARRFRWTTTAALLERERPDAEPDGGPTMGVCRVAPLLVLDDLAAERATDWTADRLGLLIDQRWSANRPMIVTTNMTVGPAGELVAAVGERIYSRLVGGAVVLQVTGADRRRRRA